MQYRRVEKALFLKRPNRFIAHVLLDGKEEIVHVKNTGRCKEILAPGTEVFLEASPNPERKTRYSLISAYKGNTLINIDSQVPNTVVAEAIARNQLPRFQHCTLLRREVTFGLSRFDLYYENASERGFIEVKGVTLEQDGIAMFPDAPTVRGTKHVYEMIRAVNSGYAGTVFFLLQMQGSQYFTPNKKTDPDFSEALLLAKNSGVQILAFDANVTPEEITLGKQVEIRL